MFKYNYLKVATISPKVMIGHSMENAKEIIRCANLAKEAEIVLFPELSITGYSIGDWFFQNQLYEEFEEALAYLVKESNEKVMIVGGILRLNSALLNVSYVIQNHQVLGVIPKQYMPKSHEFNEPRFFMSGVEFMKNTKECTVLNKIVPFGQIIFKASDYDVKFGIEICGDVWNNKSPHIDLYNQGADIIFNLSASPFYVGKNHTRELICESASIKGQGAYIYTSAGSSETSSDFLFTANQIAYVCGKKELGIATCSFTEVINYVDIDLELIRYERISNDWLETNSTLDYQIVNFDLHESESFTLVNLPNPYPFVLSDENAKDVIEITSAALYKRLSHIGIDTSIIGISGGLDSTLALLFTVETYQRYHLDLKKIIGVTMPGMVTGDKTKSIALRLMEKLKITSMELPIAEQVNNHLELIGHNQVTKDITYENAQARYRTYILMNLANLHQGIVIGTSDMSEIALGWSTFNGDQMAMYGLNSGLPKTAVKSLVAYFKKIYPELTEELDEILSLPITPELTGEKQTTEAIIGSYDINDFIMYSIFGTGYSKKRILFLLNKLFNLSEQEGLNYYQNFLKRFKRNQFKRLTAPEGIKIFDFSFSPRGDYHFPGDMK